MAASAAQVLPQGAGWAVVVGLAIGFSVVMIFITWMQERYTGISAKNNDEFASASRSVKTGLIAAGIVSAWTWAATLLQSSAVAFRYGISGPLWYACGATVQVLAFAMVAVKLKQNAPGASTFLQVIKARWGAGAHLMVMFFALVTNMLVGIMLVLGGSGTVHQLTGMPILGSIFLTPLGVAIYTLTGGMRATLLADYSHTVVLIVLLFVFAFTVYTPALSDLIGSPSRMVELLAQAAPVEGNAAGSYLTVRSRSGFIFGLINIIGNCGTIFLDQSYHQRGIASQVSTASKAFILGGLAWTAIPLTIASTLGLAARALYGQSDAMAVLTDSEISAGLPAPAAAVALLGKSGAAAMLCLLYLAVTSATSAQLIAVSSIFAFDIFALFKKEPSKRATFIASHVAVPVWALILGCLSTGFNYAGVGMGSLYVWLGIWVSSAVFPVFAAICWSKANKRSAMIGMPTGLALGVMTWLVTCYKLEGSLTVAHLSADYPVLAGNLVSIIIPTVITIAGSYIWPENYDFEGTRAIGREPARPSSSMHGSPKDETSSSPSGDAKAPLASPERRGSEEEKMQVQDLAFQSEQAKGENPDDLQKSFRMAAYISLPLTFILLVFLPCMMIIKRVWTSSGLAAWISIILLWLFISSGIVVVLPIWESRRALAGILRGIARDVRHPGTGKVERIN
ncbi:urea transporter [Ceraceosorus guamensis]|uniref:Urea transporter n=1 Tax=Ceraceosorus guamensis TaxID=1522189 RepID=A0A316VWP5_9BASI|nr:urea transporter [Ceraceosorus guamensis]PWN42067.1 urea transporter [Ceraceosorus guamensis]